MPPHYAVLKPLTTFSNSVMITFMERKVGLLTLFVKVAFAQVVFAIAVIDGVVSLGIV